MAGFPPFPVSVNVVRASDSQLVILQDALRDNPMPRGSMIQDLSKRTGFTRRPSLKLEPLPSSSPPIYSSSPPSSSPPQTPFETLHIGYQSLSFPAAARSSPQLTDQSGSDPRKDINQREFPLWNPPLISRSPHQDHHAPPRVALKECIPQLSSTNQEPSEPAGSSTAERLTSMVRSGTTYPDFVGTRSLPKTHIPQNIPLLTAFDDVSRRVSDAPPLAVQSNILATDPLHDGSAASLLEGCCDKQPNSICLSRTALPLAGLDRAAHARTIIGPTLDPYGPSDPMSGNMPQSNNLSVLHTQRMPDNLLRSHQPQLDYLLFQLEHENDTFRIVLLLSSLRRVGLIW
ncbi:hypothetical protein A0H81_11192 [Grifola frondosa]|uniref:Uncharacterized protein n=1 Tax=Grifola frondosa TaxID=5627 RepID=A0A1C7LX38_GRIFR|nr:hypothetical protein A0H81_11192 [Grifola frondosa]